MAAAAAGGARRSSARHAASSAIATSTHCSSVKLNGLAADACSIAAHKASMAAVRLSKAP